VHVNRTLQEMRHAGLIELQAKWMRIPDLKRLETLAMFEQPSERPVAKPAIAPFAPRAVG